MLMWEKRACDFPILFRKVRYANIGLYKVFVGGGYTFQPNQACYPSGVGIYLHANRSENSVQPAGTQKPENDSQHYCTFFRPAVSACADDGLLWSDIA